MNTKQCIICRLFIPESIVIKIRIKNEGRIIDAHVCTLCKEKKEKEAKEAKERDKR